MIDPVDQKKIYNKKGSPSNVTTRLLEGLPCYQCGMDRSIIKRSNDPCLPIPYLKETGQSHLLDFVSFFFFNRLLFSSILSLHLLKALASPPSKYLRLIVLYMATGNPSLSRRLMYSQIQMSSL